MHPVTQCPLCGGGGLSSLIEGLRDVHHGVPGAWRILRCGGCGLGITDPQPEPDEIARLYPPDYAPHGKEVERTLAPTGWKRGLREKPLLRWLYRAVWDSRDFWIPPLAPGGRLLDLGCGTGAFLEALKGRKWELWGVEPAPDAAQRARERGFQVHTGLLETAGHAARSFDAVFAHHVLEHLPDPLATAREVERILKPGGWFIVVVPNLDAFWFRGFGRRWFPLEIPRHLLHFSPSTVRRLAGRAGFEVVQVVQVREVVTFLSSLAEALRGPFPRVGDRVGRHVVGWRTRLLLLPLERLPNLFGASDLLLAKLRKP